MYLQMKADRAPGGKGRCWIKDWLFGSQSRHPQSSVPASVLVQARLSPGRLTKNALATDTASDTEQRAFSTECRIHRQQCGEVEPRKREPEPIEALTRRLLAASLYLLMLFID